MTGEHVSTVNIALKYVKNKQNCIYLYKYVVEYLVCLAIIPENCVIEIIFGGYISYEPCPNIRCF